MSASTPSLQRPAVHAAGSSGEVPRWIRWLVQLTRHVLDPIVLLRRAPMPIGETLVPLSADDVERLSDSMRERLATLEHALTSLGFSPPVRGTNTAFQNIRSCFSLLEHPADGGLAFILVTRGDFIGTKAMMTFRSDFDDGVQLYTTNSSVVARTPTRPGVEGARFPSIADARELYGIHRFCVAQRASRAKPIAMSRGADPLAFQAREADEVHSFWVSRGYYAVVQGPALRFTIRGAILSAWRGLFPWKQMTVWRNAWKASRVVAEFRKR
jgi:hypothetical protein